jgi:hypothetical protein
MLATHSKDITTTPTHDSYQQQQRQQPLSLIVSQPSVRDHPGRDENLQDHHRQPTGKMSNNDSHDEETEYQHTLYENGIFVTSIAS